MKGGSAAHPGPGSRSRAIPAGQDPAGQDETGQDPTGHDQAGQDRAGQEPAGVLIPDGLRARVEAWIEDDPDPGDRAGLRALLADGSATAAAELADRFAGRLEFGTAGLRGAVAAGRTG